MRSDQELRDGLHTWVRTKAPEGVTIDDDTALFEQRHIRSIHLPELILLLERLSGVPVDVEELNPRDFRSIDAMVLRFGRAGAAS
ncbi:acyl carrier protein [Streptomyces sp. HUAS TT7]|uniref:acyl carrier protein n=1 Tax=Streptomyces sp. HUAS TT7 TaxID=3447507 RepID=UPI003F655203